MGSVNILVIEQKTLPKWEGLIIEQKVDFFILT